MFNAVPQTNPMNRDTEDLGPSLQGLNGSIRSTMASVHDLNIAILNMRTGARFSEEINRLKNALKHHWTCVTDCLNKGWFIIDELYTLSKWVGQEPASECIILLQELLPKMTDVEKQYQSLVAQNAEISRTFQAASRRLVVQRRSSANDHYGPSSRPPSVTLGLSPEMRQFVQSSLAAAYPDTVSSTVSVSSSLAQTHARLSSIFNYFSNIRSVTQEIINAPNTHQGSILEDHFRRYNSVWFSNRNELFVAISSVKSSIIAMTVPATPTPRRRASHATLPVLTYTPLVPFSRVVLSLPPINPPINPTNSPPVPMQSAPRVPLTNTRPPVVRRASAFTNVRRSVTKELPPLPLSHASQHRGTPGSAPSSWKGIFSFGGKRKKV